MICEQIYQYELNRYNNNHNTRHWDFIDVMSQNLYNTRIDWDCFWSWFYHSTVSASKALEYATE